MAEQPSIKQAVSLGLAMILIQWSLGTPLLILTLWFAAVPVALMYAKTNLRWFAAAAVLSLAGGAALYGSYAFFFLALAVTTMVPGVALGECYRRRMSAMRSIRAGVIANLAVYLLAILAATLMGVNLTHELSANIRSTIDQFFTESMRSTITDEALHQYVEWNVMMIPFFLIASSTFLTAVAHTVARRIGNRMRGLSIPALPKMREWKLPKSFVWFYLIALILEMFVPVDRSSFLSTIVVNIVPLFMLAFVVQGLAFLAFLGYIKRKAWIPWVGLGAVVFIYPLFMPFSLLGVFDTAFPIRDRLRNS